MASEFENYAQDLSLVLSNVNKKINTQIPNFSGEQKKTAIRAAQKELERAADLYQDMEREALGAPASRRAQLQGQLAKYQADLQKAQRDMQATAAGTYVPTGRQELLGGGGGGGSYGGSYRDEESANDPRSRLLNANDRLGRTSDRLANTQRIAAESEEIGQNTLAELGVQREAIIRTGQKLGNVDADLGRSHKVLNSMARRIITNKVILMLTILLLIGILGITIYLKLK